MGTVKNDVKRIEQLKVKQAKWLEKNGRGKKFGHVHQWHPASKRDFSGKMITGFKCACKEVRYTDLV